MNAYSNIFTKRTLLEAVRQVVAEAGINDVLGSQWQQGANKEMDGEFYKENTAEFWEDMQHWIQVLKAADENELKQWAYEAGWDADVVQNIKHFIEYTLDFNWVKDKLPDAKVYSMMKDGEGQVDQVLKKLLSQYLF